MEEGEKNNNEVKHKTSIFKHSSLYGSYLGLLISLFYVLFYIFTELKERHPLFSILIYIFIILLIIIGSKKLRDIEGGEISYFRSFWCGVLIVFFGMIIYGFIYYLFLTFVPSYYYNLKELSLNILEEQLEISGYDDDFIDKLIEQYNLIYTRGFIFFSIVFFYTIVSVFISSITSIFIRRRNITLDDYVEH